MQVIVTGGAGFIGSRLVSALRDRGDSVRVVDLARHSLDGIVTRQRSVTDAAAMMEEVRDADVVVHLAGFVRDGMRKEPYEGCDLQLRGTLNVLEACRVNRVPHMVLASSFYVYEGLADSLTVDEQTPLDLLKPELFGAAKLMCEAMCRQYARKYGLSHTIFRLGSAYGSGGSNVVRTFIEQGLQGDPIEVWGQGRRRNQYTWVDDLASGMISGLQRVNETYNLIAPTASSTYELAALLRTEFGFAIRFCDERPEGPSMPYMAARKAILQLGWKPSLLRDGVRRTMEETLRHMPAGQRA
jgi:UDP-glucose 4-epimerase